MLVGPYNFDSDQLSTLSQDVAQRAIPFFYVHSIGFYSQFSVHLPEAFPIVDTHPDLATTQDLRLLEPWAELIEFEKSKTKNLNNLSDHEHGHVPYLLLLLHFLDNWKSSHDGNPPNDYREKKEFKSFVEGQAKKDNAEGGENFEEAASAILKSLNKPSLSGGLRDIFQELEARSLENTV